MFTCLFAYLKDDRYCINNSIARRFISSSASVRKNSLFFVSHRMANMSATYYTLVSTCRMVGVSVFEYSKKFFCEIVNSRREDTRTCC